MRKIRIFVVNINIIAYQQGTMGNPGEYVFEDNEDNPFNLIIFDNDDNDDEREGHKDKDDTQIGENDNDIIKLIIKQSSKEMSSGTIELSVTPSNTIRAFNSFGNEVIMLPCSMDLSNPSGTLSQLASGDLTLFVEGIKPSLDVKISLVLKDASGKIKLRDEIRLVSSIELILRRNIVAAANLQESSGIGFCHGSEQATCHSDNTYFKSHTWKELYNNQYYDVKGITTKPGSLSSDAIDNIFTAQPVGKEFATECLGAIILVYYKSILETFEECNSGNGRSKFDLNFPDIKIVSIFSKTPPIIPSQQYSEYMFGDWRYVNNPDYDPSTPQWQGENVIQMTNKSGSNDEFYGHGVDETTLAGIIAGLNNNRKVGATQSAYLEDNASRLYSIRLMEFLFSD